ncbi:MAG: cytochrome c-type biogenesis protein CcmH [Cellvibrionaceae bacterium]|jgi:cytochrome c-type biogenesis protein CcmH
MIRYSSIFISFLFTLLISLSVKAAIDTYQFETESQRQRYNALAEELRCPKCQNQNLAGSNSQISSDLRRELHRLLLEGKTDREIKSFMVDRYGNFVLYKPPLKLSTAMLWILPALLATIGILILISIVMKNRRLVRDSISTADWKDQDLARLKTLLNKHSGPHR